MITSLESRWILLVACAAVASAMDGRAAADSFRIEPAASRATIHVGKAGVFSFAAGHTHEISGPVDGGDVEVDLDAPSSARIRLAIAASALQVSPRGEPEGDVPQVQEAMDGPKVLDVARYPRITYESTSVALKARRGSALDLIATGRLTIRDATQPITAPVHVEIVGDRLTATGRFTIKQSAFGITPISVGGVVSVKDALDIEFSIAARK